MLNIVLKICHIISSLRTGGAQNILIQLCKTLPDHEFQHMVICLTEETKLAELLREKNIKVFCLNVHGLLGLLASIVKIRSLIKSFQPNVVQSWLYHADLISSIAVVGLNDVNLIWSVHHANKSLKFENITTRILIKILSLVSFFSPNIVIYCSKYAMKVHLAYGYKSKKSAIIYNGIDTNIYFPSSHLRNNFRRKYDLSDDVFVVGHVARYHPLKGYSVFLKMASELLTMNSNVIFVLAGTHINHQNNELTKKINDYDLSDKCLLLDDVADIATLMNGLDILICPSYSESFGLVVIEALSCEIPVICSDIDALRYIVEPSYRVSVGDAHTFAVKVYDLLNSDAHVRKLIGSRGRLQVLENYNIKKMANDYGRIYMTI